MKECAFTFYEMLITLAVMSILLAITWPALQNFSAHETDKILQHELLAAIQFAHQEALAKSSKVVLCQSLNHLQCTEGGKSLLIFTNEGDDGKVHRQEQILAIVSLPLKGILHYRSYPYYRHYLLFLAKRIHSNDNAAFWYCTKENASPRWAIMLSKTGRARIVNRDKEGKIKNPQGTPLTC